MLILTRRPGDTVIIEPYPDTPVSYLSGLFSQLIEVRILRVDGSHVRIGIEAADGLRIWRAERAGLSRNCPARSAPCASSPPRANAAAA